MSARDELNTLFDRSIQVALHLVEKHGSHMPFAVGLTTDGEIQNIAADDSDLPGAEALHEWLVDYVEKAISIGHFRAIAIARNIELTSKEGVTSDAVEVTLDHLNDDAVVCYLPYRLDAGGISVGQVSAAEAETTLFP